MDFLRGTTCKQQGESRENVRLQTCVLEMLLRRWLGAARFDAWIVAQICSNAIAPREKFEVQNIEGLEPRRFSIASCPVSISFSARRPLVATMPLPDARVSWVLLMEILVAPVGLP